MSDKSRPTLVLILGITSGCGILQWSMLNQPLKDQTERLDTEYPMYKINDRTWLDRNDDHCTYLGLIKADEIRGTPRTGKRRSTTPFPKQPA